MAEIDRVVDAAGLRLHLHCEGEGSPTVVFDTIGKNATIQAQTKSARNGSRTQMMISGAIATIGVTCRITA